MSGDRDGGGGLGGLGAGGGGAGGLGGLSFMTASTAQDSSAATGARVVAEGIKVASVANTINEGSFGPSMRSRIP